jgi:general secretion pathway protein E
VEEADLHRQLSNVEKTSFTRGAGCDQCAKTGYRGRIGVFEVLTLTDSIKRLIANRASVEEIRKRALKDGMLTMRKDAVAKVDQDITTMSEVIRSVYLA